MWRGRAFGEFADEWWARPEASRLEELRLVAIEERIDALLALDRHAEAVPDLERLTAAHPYRERFTAQLMVALHRSGREVEAHRTYQRSERRWPRRPGSSRAPSWCSSTVTSRPVRPPSARPTSAGCAATSVGEVLGEGAFGTVYRATQPGLGREVASEGDRRRSWPTTPRSCVGSRSRRSLVARLEHPHIVPLYDFWREPGGAYLVFRLLRGGTAAEALVRDGPWSLDRVDRFVEEIGGALVAAHGAGVVHRDVKPSNVLFDETGNAYLSDFGIAQIERRGDDAATRRPAGSPLYASAPSRCTSTSRRPARTSTASRSRSGSCSPARARSGADGPVGALADGLPEPPIPPAGRARGRRRRAADGRRRRVPTSASRSMAEMLLAWRQAVGPPAGRPHHRRGGRRRPAAGRRGAARSTQVELAAINPYKGLQPFREADAIDFHGRSSARRPARRRGRGEPVRHRGRAVGVREELARPRRAGPAAARRRPRAGRVDGARAPIRSTS